ncbi:MAG: SDR family NAD(P)-dependent oxidoreductase [Ruminococcaceae bacterium]|nr:SDR family NAD(P)-dependent oxidoreductase [Oscillospiraceae bacterium]
MKIAVVTGASSGMGRDFVLSIDKSYELDEIWVIARRQDRLEELKSQCRTSVRPIALDLLDTAGFAVYSQLLEQEKPEIQILVNAAGFGLFGEFTEMNLDGQLDIIRLNDIALTAITYLSIPYMSKGSSIIQLASNSSWQPVPYINVYGASKAYVLSFSRALRMELKGKGIHVMAVAPGWIKTEFFDHAVHDNTISYYDRFYTSQQVVDKAMKDLKKKKQVSILGFPVRLQVLAVKLLPVNLIMNIWCKQQGK